MADRGRIEPVKWNDIDLQAWRPLYYVSLSSFEHMPALVNRPASAFDLNNLAYCALTLGDLSPFRLADDVLAPVTGVDPMIGASVEAFEAELLNSGIEPVAGIVRVLDLPGVALADYSFASLGNLRRYDRAIDWLQEQGLATEEALTTHAGGGPLPGSSATHAAVDGFQSLFWQTHGWLQALVFQALDETILNTLENETDRIINAWRTLPAEISVDERPLVR
jgi:hypothetical protein